MTYKAFQINMDKYIILLEILCAISVVWAVDFQEDPRTLEFERILSKNVMNHTDLCQFMSYSDCQRLIEEVNFSAQSGDKIAVSGRGPKIAGFDACNPRMQTIAIPRHPDPEILIWPPCTRAMRCGGCCTSDVFSCEPTRTKDTYIKVFDTKLGYPGAQRVQFMGIRNVRIEEHAQCDAQCKTKPHQCHKYQIYRPRQCRCECKPERLKLRATCHQNQRWDDSECDCICPNRATTKCPPPFRFSRTTCKCTIKTAVTGEIDLDVLIEQLDRKLLEINRNQENSPDLVDIVSLLKLTGHNSGHGGKEPFIDNAIDEGEITANVEPEVEETTPEVTKPTSTTTTTSTTESTTTTTTTTTKPTSTTEKIVKTTEDPNKVCEKLKPCAGNWRYSFVKGKCRCFPPVFFLKQRKLGAQVRQSPRFPRPIGRG